MDIDKPLAPMSWMQRLRRVFAVDIDPGRVQRIRDHSTQAVVLDVRELEPGRPLSAWRTAGRRPTKR